MKLSIPASYRLPVALAVALHLLLIIFLFVRSTHQGSPLPVKQSAPQPTIVQAVTVSQAAVAQQVRRIKQRQQRHQHAAQARLRHLRAQAAAAKQRRVAEQRRLVVMQAKQRRIKQRQMAAAKALRLKKQRVKVARHKALVAQHRHAQALVKQQQQLQKKLLQQQLATEQQRIKQVHVRQVQGMANQYRQKMLSYIGSHWIVPEPAQRKTWSCIFSVHLAINGDVLRVKLLKSSGHPALDRSARAAIYKSSPLPVPTNSEVFDKLRELRLTMSPQTIQVENIHG